MKQEQDQDHYRIDKWRKPGHQNNLKSGHGHVLEPVREVRLWSKLIETLLSRDGPNMGTYIS